jgi:hypothetical protein
MGEEDAYIKLRDRAQMYAAAVIAITDATGDNFDVVKDWLFYQDSLGNTFPDVTTALAAYTGQIDIASASQTSAAESAGLMTEEQKKAADELRNKIAMYQAYSAAGTEYGAALAFIGNSAATGLRTGSANVEAIGQHMAVLRDNTASAGEKVQALDGLLKALNDAAFGIGAASDAYQSGLNGLKGLAEELAKSGTGWASGSDAAIAFRGHVRDMAGDLNDVAVQMAKAGEGPEAIRSKLAEMGQAAQDEAKRLGLPAESMRDLTDAITRVPIDTIIEIHTPNVDDATVQVQGLTGELERVSLGAIGLIAVRGADGATASVRDANGELHTFAQGANGVVSVQGADGAWYSISLVNGQLQAVRQGASGRVDVDTSDATRKLNDLRALIGITVADGSYGRGLGVLKPPGSAIGGPINGGQTKRVAEQGIELYKGANGAMSLLAGPTFTAPDAGMIFTADRTRQMLRPQSAANYMTAGGGAGRGGDTYVTVQVEVPGYLGDLSELEAAVVSLAPEIKEAIRRDDKRGG